MYVAGPPNDERSLVLRLIDGNEDAFCELDAAYKNHVSMPKMYFKMLSLLFGKVVALLIRMLLFLLIFIRLSVTES